MNIQMNTLPYTVPITHTKQGYDRLAALITSDKGLSIFRSFKHLNAKNLLYLQAEIVNLEAELEELIEKDAASKQGHNAKFSTSVRLLKEANSEQWKKWVELRELLERYNTAKLQYTQTTRLKPPHKQDLAVLRDWLSTNAFCSTLTEFDQWFGEDDENTDDLVSLCGRYENVDSLTRWVFRSAIPWFHRVVGFRHTKANLETGTVYYDDERIIRATRVTSIITSSVIPASSMLVLYLVNDMILRLAIIIVYNIAFSVVIGLLAKARRVEVFAASTAYVPTTLFIPLFWLLGWDGGTRGVRCKGFANGVMDMNRFAAVQVAFITNFPRD
ncbi:hypothetical protein BJY04DRAFT_220799 [Aspergillus karnatakaensis]|uniref:uncharacterized protein n=1 Tax=Aspergillus karnatakaensis TaxID=1810916 RepID=UPI003CCDDEB3